jgi:hypothetical protein
VGSGKSEHRKRRRIDMSGRHVSVATLVAASLAIATAAHSGVGPTMVPAPPTLTFHKQTIATRSEEQTVTVTNLGESPVAISDIKATAEFSVNHKCETLKPGESCALRVAFRPIAHGHRSGDITVTAKGDPKPLLIRVTGRGGFPSFPGGVLLIAALYCAVMWTFRSELIVEPAWRQLQAQADRVESRIPVPGGVPQVVALLTQVRQRVFMFSGNALVRTLAGWRRLHEAEQDLIGSLSPEDVRVAMELAEQRLRDDKTEVSKSLANNIRDALAAVQVAAPVPQPMDARWRSLLREATTRLNEAEDANFETLADWYNKTMWLVVAGLLFIILLAFAFDRALLFLLGATAGFLSRLARSLDRENLPTDYGASWSTLFLSPVAGALAGWIAVLLFAIAKKLGLLGGLVDVNWDAPYEPMAMGLAFLLGFSERAFDTILAKMEGKIGG